MLPEYTPGQPCTGLSSQDLLEKCQISKVEFEQIMQSTEDGHSQNIKTFRRLFEISADHLCIFNKASLMECIEQVLLVVNSGKLSSEAIQGGVTP